MSPYWRFSGNFRNQGALALSRLPWWCGMALLFSAFLVGCGAAQGDPYPPFRYRMTVEVETPEGLRTGSAVREVDYVPAAYAGGDFAVFRLRLRGEAVAVDLPGGKTLYALLRSPTHSDFAAQIAIDTLLPVPPSTRLAAGTSGPNPSTPEFEAAFAGLLANSEVRELPRERAMRWSGGPGEAWPLFVTFRDPADPASVERVDPDDMTAHFGRGTRIRRIILAITDDPVTTGIERRLGWIDQFYDRMLDGQRLNNSQDLANNLASDSFSTETVQ
jgi:hypothetical protein